MLPAGSPIDLLGAFSSYFGGARISSRICVTLQKVEFMSSLCREKALHILLLSLQSDQENVAADDVATVGTSRTCPHADATSHPEGKKVPSSS